MAQVKIYGLKNRLSKRRSALSDAIHEALMAAFELPENKRFQRFIGMDEADFIHPKDRSADYTIIEISLFEGRSVESKKKLITPSTWAHSSRPTLPTTISRSRFSRRPGVAGASAAGRRMS